TVQVTLVQQEVIAVDTDAMSHITECSGKIRGVIAKNATIEVHVVGGNAWSGEARKCELHAVVQLRADAGSGLEIDAYKAHVAAPRRDLHAKTSVAVPV